MMTWLGVDKVDDDGDGLPDSLETGGPVECRVHPRAFRPVPHRHRAAARVPRSRADPLRPHLRPRARALRDPRAADREGVLLAGSLRWVPRPLARRLRGTSTAGGRLAASAPVAAPRRAGRRKPAHAADAADPDRPVRRSARAASDPRTGETAAAAAADRARRGSLARPPHRLRRELPAFGRLEESARASPRSAAPRC